MTTSESDGFKLLSNIKHLIVSYKFSFHTETFYFIQTWSLPMDTPVHSQFSSGFISHQIPSIPPASWHGGPCSLPCLCFRRCCLFIQVTHHGFLRLGLGVQDSQPPFPPCPSPWCATWGPTPICTALWVFGEARVQPSPSSNLPHGGWKTFLMGDSLSPHPLHHRTFLPLAFSLSLSFSACYLQTICFSIEFYSLRSPRTGAHT